MIYINAFQNPYFAAYLTRRINDTVGQKLELVIKRRRLCYFRSYRDRVVQKRPLPIIAIPHRRCTVTLWMKHRPDRTTTNNGMLEQSALKHANSIFSYLSRIQT